MPQSCDHHDTVVLMTALHKSHLCCSDIVILAAYVPEIAMSIFTMQDSRLSFTRRPEPSVSAIATSMFSLSTI